MAPTLEHFNEAIKTVLSPAPHKVDMNVKGLTYRLMSHGRVTTASGDFTLEDFVAVREQFQQVREKIGSQWRDGASDTVEGKHEWIPTDMIAYVAENVRNKPYQWRAAMDLLRSPTQYVVYLLPAPNPKYRKGDPLSKLFDLNGHVGALHHKEEPGLRIKNMGPWHDGLREILRTHLNRDEQKEDFLGFAGAMLAYIKSTCWNGTFSGLSVDPKLVPCDYYMDRQCSQLWGANLMEMGQKLNAGYNDWSALLNKNIEVIGTHY